jgi:hypothetical protein
VYFGSPAEARPAWKMRAGEDERHLVIAIVPGRNGGFPLSDLGRR